jgi:DNA-binding IclR family transcriptional regulator
LPQFLRPVEARVIAAMAAREDELVEALVARTGMPPSDAAKALSSLVRRGLVAMGEEGMYALTTEGIKAQNAASSRSESRSVNTPVFLLDDPAESAAVSTSNEDISAALDRVLGKPNNGPEA